MKQSVRMGRRAAGFTLVELMVALVIGLIIVLGAGQIFLMGKQTYDRVSELALRQESLRYLTDLVSLDIRTATVVGTVGSTLTLDYGPGVRPNDPYCSGNDLTRVEYTLDGTSVMFQVWCGVAEQYGPDALIEDVAGLSFDSANPLYVEVGVDFEAMSDEPVSNAAFSFIVARRENVITSE